MSINAERYLDPLTVWEDEAMRENTIGEMWVQFVSHLKRFI